MAVNIFKNPNPYLPQVSPEKLRAMAAAYDPNIHGPKYTCSQCSDQKWIRTDLPVGDPHFGELVPCPHCNQAARFQRGRHGIFRSDYDLTWDDLIRFPESNAVQVARKVSEILERGWGGVYLWSEGYGTAKTEIMRIAVAEWLRNTGKDARFILFADLIDELTAAFGNNRENDKPTGDPWDRATAYQRLQIFQSIPLLCIDELEETNLTTYANNTRFRLFNERSERAVRLFEGVTLITSNVPPARLPGKIFSRFSDVDFMIFLEVTGKDVRPVMSAFRKHPGQP